RPSSSACWRSAPTRRARSPRRSWPTCATGWGWARRAPERRAGRRPVTRGRGWSPPGPQARRVCENAAICSVSAPSRARTPIATALDSKLRDVSVADLDLELDVFAGPFDLLMAVVLREGVDLAEVELGEIVVAYVEHLEEQGELDLEAATEFLVLIAALLE